LTIRGCNELSTNELDTRLGGVAVRLAQRIRSLNGEMILTLQSLIMTTLYSQGEKMRQSQGIIAHVRMFESTLRRWSVKGDPPQSVMDTAADQSLKSGEQPQAKSCLYETKDGEKCRFS
jgi:hypothetical protein